MISIVIPTLNEELRLAATLQSLRTGLGTIEHEVIVSDGGSTDRTVAIAKQYADRVVTHTDHKKQTIAGGRNAGAWVARGEYLVFLDADVTIPEPKKFFREVLELFKTNTRLVGLCVALMVNPPEAKKLDRFFSALVNGTHVILNNYVKVGSAMGEFQMVRREQFLKVGGFNERLVAGEDNELFWRLRKTGTTRMEHTWTVFHSGRRAHQIGWIPLLAMWILNVMSVFLFRRAFSKVWIPIR